jgi:hypothetical protein
VELTGAVGHGLSQDCGALGNQGLCSSFGFPASSRVRSPLPLHRELAGALRQRDKEADEGGGNVVRGGWRRKALYLVLSQLDEEWGARRLR